MAGLIDQVQAVPLVGRRLGRLLFSLTAHRTTKAFPGSSAYWRQRYDVGGDSGRGSYGQHARFKAGVLNAFVADESIGSVIEFGCGDGNQLSLASYPRYIGFDISEAALAACSARFAGDSSKIFRRLDEYEGERADLGLSLDVVFHLVEDDVFDAHMRMLFGAAERFVIVYSTNVDDRRILDRAHVRHRRFTSWIEVERPDWGLCREVANPRAKDRRSARFHIFERRAVPS